MTRRRVRRATAAMMACVSSAVSSAYTLSCRQLGASPESATVSACAVAHGATHPHRNRNRTALQPGNPIILQLPFIAFHLAHPSATKAAQRSRVQRRRASAVRCDARFGGDVTSHPRSLGDSGGTEATPPVSDEPSYFRRLRDSRARVRNRTGRPDRNPAPGVRTKDARSALSDSPGRTPRLDCRGRHTARAEETMPSERRRALPPLVPLAQACSLGRTARPLAAS